MPGPSPSRGCSIEGCKRNHYGRGWCNPHYQRWLRTGSPVGSTRTDTSVDCRCEVCDVHFSVQAARFRRYNVRFCSRRCLGRAKINEVARLAAIQSKRAHNNGNATVSCAVCKRRFAVPPSQVARRRHCSRSCYAAMQRVLPKPDRYVIITVNGKRVRLHRYVMEQHLGRKLESWEQVHHINRDRQDNRLSNLQVLSASEHGKISASHRGVPRSRQG